MARRPSGGEHRPDVQALRALAVSAVVLFHLWPDLLPGGYVGVDVFFVISGYLITGLLFRELDGTGRVRLLAFYARRIRRLLPAALFVLGVTLAAMLLLLPWMVWRTNLAAIASASTYVLNWHLGLSSTDYLAADDTPSLVQHYWSLSVEEQFYLLWPVLLIASAWCGHRAFRASRRTCTVAALGIVLVASLAASVVETRLHPQLAFFATQDRAWEFALGGLVALLAPLGQSLGLVRVAGWSGLALIVGSCLVLDGSAAFPGIVALLPTGGAALVLAAGSTPARGSLREVARWAPVQWVGDHSYALYLWHWPPVVALPWLLHEPMGNLARISMLALTVALAWVTKRWVEDPVRHGQWWSMRLWPAFQLAGWGTLAIVLTSTLAFQHLSSVRQAHERETAANLAKPGPCFGAAALMDATCPGRFARPDTAAVAFAPTDFPPMEHDCQQRAADSPEPLWCSFGDPDPDAATVALVGNSFALQFTPMVEDWARGRHVRILLASRVDCLGLTTDPVTGQRADDPCPSWSARVQARLLDTPSLAAVVFVTHARSAQLLTGQDDPRPDAVAQASAEVMRSWAAFRGAGIATAAIGHAPGTGSALGLECLAMSQDDDDPCAFSRSRLPAPDLATALADEHPELTTYVPLSPYFCDEQLCHTTIGGVVAYYDTDHISTTYVRTLAPYLGGVLTELTGVEDPSDTSVRAVVGRAASGPLTLRQVPPGW